MKNKGPYFFKKAIPIPMYGGYFIIIFSNDINKVCAAVDCDTAKVPGLYAHTFHNFLYNKYESFAVCFNFWCLNTITTGTIVHEVNHAGNRLLMSREVIPDYENDEAESYLKSWMADEVEKFMKKCNIV
jgi:hypothetical protein